MMGPVLTGSGKIWWQVMPAGATRSAVDQVLNSRLLGVPCGPVRQLADHTPAGLRRISTQKRPIAATKTCIANHSRPVSAAIPNADYSRSHL